VNSGRATRERNIEATALKTNMEAAEEAARQLRLRDLAGLVVIDFIDMDEAKNNRAVEKKLKDCLKDDRARVQMGKISAFGLMEISRQRRRSGVLEGTTHVCEHCAGTGRVRSVESSALAALRAVEIEALKGGGEATLTVPRAVGLYILNEKRGHLARLFDTMGLFVTIVIDDALAAADHQIERTAAETRPEHAAIAQAAKPAYAPAVEEDDFDDSDFDDEEDEEEDEDETVALAEDEEEADRPRQRREVEAEGDEQDERGGRRGRRRRRRGRRGDEPRAEGERATEAAPPRDDEEDGQGGRRRRRGRRGGRRMREDRPNDAFAWTRPWVPYGEDPFVWYDPAEDFRQPAPADEARSAPVETPAAAEAASPAPVILAPAADGDDIWVELPATEEKPKRARSRRGRGRGKGDAVESAEEVLAEAPALDAADVEAIAPAAPREAEINQPAVEVEPPAPAKRSRARKPKAAAAEAPAAEAPIPVPALEPVATAPLVPEPEPEPAAAAASALVSSEDPAEITSPPAQPKRGWWRRG
jgi:ribonuclease E